jgi:hypothetical protein
MNEPVEAIELAFVSLAESVEAVRSVKQFEPGAEGLGRLPCVTMLYLGKRRTGAQTGNVEELEPTWRVYVYVALKDYPSAQREWRDVADALQDAVRANYRLPDSAGNPTCDQADLVDELRDPVPVVPEDGGPGHLYKELKLTVQLEET